MLIGVVENDAFVFLADKEEAAALQHGDNTEGQVFVGRFKLGEVGRIQTDGEQRDDQIHDDDDHGRAEHKVDRVDDRPDMLVGTLVDRVVYKRRENVRVHAVFDALVYVNEDVIVRVIASGQNVSESRGHDNCE